jgi:hypothetical protein
MPDRGIEPRTFALQEQCTATMLIRRSFQNKDLLFVFQIFV